MSEKHRITTTRRNVLLGLGTVGLASAGAGLGTTAYFSDTESFLGNSLDAGEFDLRVRYVGQYNEAGEPMWGQSFGIIDGVDSIMGGAPASESAFGFVVDDLKPGDSGVGEFCFQIIDNPGYVTVSGEVTENDENGYTEPEPTTAADGDVNDPGDPDGEGELLDALQVAVSYSDGSYSDLNTGSPPTYLSGTAKGDVFEGSLREFFASEHLFDADPSTDAPDPVPGTDDATEFAEPCLLFELEVPTTAGNELQTDLLGFSVVFSAIQARHNTVVTSDVGSGFVDVAQSVNVNNGYGDDGEGFASKTITGRARHGDSAGAATYELATGTASPTGDQQQIDWAPSIGNTTDFAFTYDADAGDATLAIDGAAASTISGVSAPAGRIGLQAKADEATVAVENVQLSADGTPVTVVGPDEVTATNDGAGREIRYLVLETDAADLADGFEITGDLRLEVQGDFDGGHEDFGFDVVVE
ncbi:hypothetical protein B4589_005225 [Halolamina sp. CBA1230]|uniref:SipW-dependent-type signal peptide-containing protein n=1 Tax=Halolamina sp. CBA1230 TaxID=1853690 RepID=UPI0009A191D2|nr:SipW-dependent-type signal peptide-containing protein [Halolamina sp. CBA1230]QKY19809.1 hypothetical protein B4589_005225 [Halolamina sp. CBA1230]